ncbi:MAG: class II aldolase/adducin family protein [Aquisalimonadaceae bacterium]
MPGEREGVVGYNLEHSPGAAPPRHLMARLDAWRTVLFRLALVGGRDPDRYHGLGFGNVSRRLASGFLISGTQTGHLPVLNASGYCQVLECDSGANRIRSIGPVPPSSEALSHGAVYAARPRAGCVLHAHSPDIWNAARQLDLPASSAAVPYGTPEMAAELDRLCRQSAMRDRGIFAMGGHEDGVIAYGPDEETAGQLLVATLARALAR